MILRAFLPQEEDDFQNAEEELELDQSSELYKTIVAAIIKEEDDGDVEEEDVDIGEDVYDEEKTPARDAEVKTDSEAGGRVIKRFVKVVIFTKQQQNFYARLICQDKRCRCSEG